jgi:hypothetical protein
MLVIAASLTCHTAPTTIYVWLPKSRNMMTIHIQGSHDWDMFLFGANYAA